MESPLEVLSRAATMVQDNSTDTRLSSKELPTTKWRRERRARLSNEYHQSNIKPLSEANPIGQIIESPLDMSIGTIKPRTPPPPYREPLPGSKFANGFVRPSVITQAPKRELLSNRENNEATEVKESISMIDPVIDEHFRRSLGADYHHLFGTNRKSMSPPTRKSVTPPIVSPDHKITTKKPVKPNGILNESKDTISMSVDDHFAKALGDTWKRLQADRHSDDEDRQSTPSPIRQCGKN